MDILATLAPAEDEAIPLASALPEAILHPNFLLRIAGESHLCVDSLADGATVAALERYLTYKRALGARVPAVCDEIAAAIPKITNQALSNRALSLRRDLFNLRRPKVAPAELEAFIDPAFLGRLTLACQEIQNLQQLKSAVAEAYAAEIAAGRKALEAAFGRPNLNAGVLYSSPTLFQKLGRMFDGAGEGFSPKEILDLENSLLSYLLRTAKKTSPQSSFTLFRTGAWGAAPKPDWDLDTLEASLSPCLRRDLIRSVVTAAERDIRFLGWEARVEFNPHIRISPENLSWARLLPDGRDVSLTWRATRRGAAINLVEAALAEAQGVLTLGELAGQLRLQFAQSAEDQSDKLLAYMLKEEILVSADRVPYASQEDILPWALASAARLQTPLGEALHTGLSRIRNLLDEYPRRFGSDRVAVLRELEHAAGELNTLTRAEIPAEIMRPVLHENCETVWSPPPCDEITLAEVIEDLSTILLWNPLFDDHLHVHAWLADRFVAQYGAHGKCEDVEQFLLGAVVDFERALAEPNHPSGRPVGDIRRLSGSSALIDQVGQVREALRLHILQCAETDGEVRLDRDYCRNLARQLPASILARSQSRCFLGHVMHDPGGTRFVINQIHVGGSKLISRFLPLGDPGLPALRDYQNRISRGGRLAEIPGVFGFNVNLHPPLADFELQLSYFAANRSETPKIGLSEAVLRYDPASRQVYLATRDGRPFDAVFAGLMHVGLLPPIHRALDALRSSGQWTWNPGREIAFASPPTQDEIRRSPRVSLGSVILSRETWYAPASLLPDPRQTDEDFFIAVQQWRAAHGVARQVYMRLPGETGEDGAPPISRARRTVLNRKPLYVDFENPMIVRLVRKTLKGSLGPALFSEALPGPDGANLRVAGQPHACEFGIELSTRPESG